MTDILLKHPDLKIRIEGHADNVGIEAFNQKLSEGRAWSVNE
ncbi:MAG: OmpA family protein [Myxococcaceae bacterium]